MCGPFAELLIYTDKLNEIKKNLSEMAEEFLSKIDIDFSKIEITPYNSDGILVYTYRKKTDSNDYNNLIGSFTLVGMPSCPYMGISINTYVNYKHQNKGIASLLHSMKSYICKKVGVKALIATVNKDNTHEISSLKKNNWKQVDSIGEVGLWVGNYEGIKATIIE